MKPTFTQAVITMMQFHGKRPVNSVWNWACLWEGERPLR